MTDSPPILRVEKLTKRYSVRKTLAAKSAFTAFQDVSLAIPQQTTLALLGPSGSGKSTLALCIAGLERPTGGSIVFNEQELTGLSEKKLRQIRPQIQLVFQDPARSLNPRWSARDLVAEPLVLQNLLTSAAREKKVLQLLDFVAVPRSSLHKSAHQFSGGQKQRLAIARALALEPRLLLLDEALSALDCSTQAQIANLLLDLQSRLRLAYLLITHDLAMAAHLADHIAVMHHGHIVESGPAAPLLRDPQHEATRSLLAGTPGSRQSQTSAEPGNA